MENTVNKGGRICLPAIINCLSKTDIKAGAEMQKGMPNVTLDYFNEGGVISFGTSTSVVTEQATKFAMKAGLKVEDKIAVNNWCKMGVLNLCTFS